MHRGGRGTTVFKLWIVLLFVSLTTLWAFGLTAKRRAGDTIGRKDDMRPKKTKRNVKKAVSSHANQGGNDENKGLSVIEGLLASETDKATWGKEVPEDWQEVKSNTGCDIFTVPFDPEKDKRCISYMSDLDNWEKVKPLPQAFDMRTIKFKVTFKEDRLHAIVKVPQRSFPVEGISEVGAYHGDRVMEVNRVPPTGWVPVPVKVFMDSVAEHGKKMSLVQQFAKEASAGSFIEWVTKDFSQFARERSLVHDGKVHVSVQLFVADVRRLLDSALAIPYKAHNGSWSRWLDPRHPYPPNIKTSIYHISELVTYDYVMGNSDRSPNKNNFVVGACKGKCTKKLDTPRHPGWPSFVHLDNGMCFYTPQRNPINGKEWEMCIFQARLVAKLRELQTTFTKSMTRAMPSEAFAALGKNKIHLCEKRIAEVLRKVDKCLDNYDEEIVLP